METKLLDKHVKIFLKNSFCFTGKVVFFDDKAIEIIDKFGLSVSLSRDEIRSIVEVKA